MGVIGRAQRKKKLLQPALEQIDEQGMTREVNNTYGPGGKIPNAERSPIPAIIAGGDVTSIGSETYPRIVISVYGGIAEVVQKPEGLEVAIFDYDVQAEDGPLAKDLNGNPCVVSEYPASEKIGD